MIFSFQRLTTQNRYLPFVDGMRFIAITWVMLYHLHGQITKKPSWHLIRILKKEIK